jgi:hypothetical protein
MKTSTVVGALALWVCVAIAAPVSAQFAALDWTFVDADGYSSGTLSDELMTLVGPDGGVGESQAFYMATAPSDGTVFVNLYFAITDDQLGFDSAAYVIDGDVTGVWNAWEHSQDLMVMFDVSGGSSFGLGATSVDSIYGAVHTTWTEFQFLPATPTAVDLVHGGVVEDHFGAAVSGAGDLDGDGIPDVLVGVPGADVGSLDAGQVQILSGADGALLDTIDGAVAGDAFGTDLDELGDVDGDGVSDFAVSAPFSDAGGLDSGAVVLFSGADRTVIRVHAGQAPNDRFGASLAAVADANGDGVGDLLVGAPLNDEAGNKAGKAILFSGADGSILRSWLGAVDREEFGTAVADLGDADGDGVCDVLVSAPLSDTAFENAGAVRAFSGADGSQLWEALGGVNNADFGLSIDGAGDVDGDGLADAIVSTLRPSNRLVEVLRGTDGAVLYEYDDWAFVSTAESSVAPEIGRDVAGVGDVDDDGRDDFMFSAGPALPGTGGYGAVIVCSGRSGDILHAIHGEFHVTTFYHDVDFGASIDVIGDLDGDGRVELVVGSAGGLGNDPQPGRVRTAGIPLVWADLGHGLAGAGGVPTLQPMGLLQGDTPWKLVVSGGALLANTVVVLGLSELSAPFKGGVLVPQPDILIGGLVTGAAGELSLQGTWPPGTPADVPFWLQAWIADGGAPAGFAATNGVRGITW